MQVWLPHGTPTNGWERARITLPGAAKQTSVDIVSVRVLSSGDEPTGYEEADLPAGVAAAFLFHFRDADDQTVLDRFVWDSFFRGLKEGEFEDLRGLPRIECFIDDVLVSNIGGVREVQSLPAPKSARILDMSPQGLKLAFSGELPVGASIRLTVSVPGDERPLILDGVVTHSSVDDAGPPGYAGVAFVEEMSEVNRARIRNFILASSAWGSLRGVYRRLWDGSDRGSQLKVEEELAIRRILSDSADRKLMTHLLQEDNSMGFTTQLVKVDEDLLWVTDLAQEAVLPPVGTHLRVSLTVDGGSYYFQTRTVHHAGSELGLSLPDSMVFTEKRGTHRASHGARVRWSIKRSDAADGAVTGYLLDSSDTGVSVEVHDAEFASSVAGASVVLGPHPDGMSESVAKELLRRGEVRHVRAVPGSGGNAYRLGIELGTRRRNLLTSSIGSAEFQSGKVYEDAVSVANSAAYKSLRLEFPAEDGRPIVGLLNATALGKVSTVVIVPPAFGKKKEALASLALTLLATFRSRGEEVAVLRFDGTDRPGESANRLENPARGYEMLGYRISQGRGDLEAAIRYAENNPIFSATRMVLTTFSMSALDGRRLLADSPLARHVSLWISVMGVPAAKSALVQTLGGLDIVSNHAAGIPSGVCGLLGHLLDMDQVAADLVEHRYAHMTDARADMARIDIPVLWVYGTHDRWVGPEEIEDVMSIEAGAPRGVIQIPAGHNLRTSDDALRTFRLIASFAAKGTVEAEDVANVVSLAQTEAKTAPKDELLDLVTFERERLEIHRELSRLDEYWRRYLIGSGASDSGYDFYRNLKPFVEFLRLEAELLAPEADSRVLDAGCGTGLFLEVLLSRLVSASETFTGAITACDLVPTALERAKEKADRVQESYDVIVPVEYRILDLEPNRLVPVARYIGTPGAKIEELRGRIEGLGSQALEELVLLDSEDAKRVVEGCIDPEGLGLGDLTPHACEVLRELGRAGRFLQGTLQYGDLRSPQPNSSAPSDGPRQEAELTTADLIFDHLNFRDAAQELALPFADGSYDRIMASLFISYIFNADYLMEEFYRICRPGGKIVLSSMKPDSDISVIFTEFVAESTKQGVNQVTMTGARQMLSEAAALFELEEEGLFQFYTEEQLADLLLQAGFSDIETCRGLGDPYQAVIATAFKR